MNFFKFAAAAAAGIVMTTLSYRQFAKADNDDNGASTGFREIFEEIESLETLLKEKDNKFIYIYRGNDGEADNVAQLADGMAKETRARLYLLDMDRDSDTLIDLLKKRAKTPEDADKIP